MDDLPPSTPVRVLISDQEQFSKWSSLNDTIMGGDSTGKCYSTDNGLLLSGELIEKGGGFVSCRSSYFSPSLNLSEYKGLQIEVEGEGRTLKFGVSCDSSVFGFTSFPFIPRNIKWVASIPTKDKGVTVFKIPFTSLEPSIRAKHVSIPVKFNPNCINQFQLLHSKFGQPGRMNLGFKPGPFKILLRSINAYF